MKVVVVNEGLAYPPTAGNWIRTLNLMLPLARRHDVTYVCRGATDPGAVEVAREFYADHGIRALITDDHPAPKRRLGFYGRLAANLFSPLPYSIDAHNSSEVRGVVATLAANERVDLWQFETLSYADSLPRGARSVIVAHNVESQIWQRMYEVESHPLKRWYIGHQWRKFERYERQILGRATRVVAVSSQDATLLREKFGVADAAVVDNGVDIEYFTAAARARRADPNQILFLGSLEWRPNLDAVRLLLNRIFPAVVAQVPEARLCLVGRNPPGWLVEQARLLPNVALHADVPDVRPYLSGSGVMAVPLRIGGGSRLKILEAVAADVPVVTTRVGCEGLEFRHGRDVLIAEEIDDIAPALVKCMREPAHAAAMARRARRVVDQRYGWVRLADRLEATWMECARSSPPGVAHPSDLSAAERDSWPSPSYRLPTISTDTRASSTAG